jgi:hypothetical protein
MMYRITDFIAVLTTVSSEFLLKRVLLTNSGDVFKPLDQWFPNFFGPPPPWFHKIIPSAPYPTLYKAFFRIAVCTTH